MKPFAGRDIVRGMHVVPLLADAGPLPIILIIVVVIGLMIWGGIHGAKVAKARREALAALAAELRFTFEPNDRPGALPQVIMFSTFNVGEDRKSYNTFTGEIEVNGRPVPVAMGDYRYTTESGSGKDRRKTTHQISYLSVILPYNAAAKLAVRRENWGDKLVAAIGFDDIDFESAEFSKAFHVKCDDKKFAYDLFEPRMIEWFQTSSPPPLQTVGRSLILLDGGRWSADQFRDRVEWIRQFLSKWPAHLVQRLDSSSPPTSAII